MRRFSTRWWVGALVVCGCQDIQGMDAADPARGPGQLVGNGDPVSDGNFVGGNDAMPEALASAPERGSGTLDCDQACRDYCGSLPLENPVNIGICPSLWGVGLPSQPVDRLEACRRLYVDFVGRYPTPSEINDVCTLPTWGETVRVLLADPRFERVNQRRWADKLLYNNRAVNFERAYDMDELVGKTYRGLVSWDQFAAVTSAHPMLVRRHDTAGDRVESAFKLFLGRPPYENERSDLARLYRLWNNGYWEHPHIGVVPDAFVEFACVDADGTVDPERVGECTSVLWGRRQLVLKPDRRRLEHEGEQEGLMWAGFVEPEEWEILQMPGQVIASQPTFWEHAVDEVLRQYLGYDLGSAAPEVRRELVRYALQYNGDVRALHFAVATSFLYLQSNRGDSITPHRWTYGPLKQIEVEGWIDSIKHTTGARLSTCDHRLPQPMDYVGEDAREENGEISGWAYALVENSRWELDDNNEVIGDYASLARTLGGCPSNEVGGRFTSVSVLNTAVQEAFIAEVCGIGDAGGVDAERLLPPNVSSDTALDETVAEQIATYQQQLFIGRAPTDEELEEARNGAAQCAPAPCRARDFARPMCFALLSSADMLFY